MGQIELKKIKKKTHTSFLKKKEKKREKIKPIQNRTVVGVLRGCSINLFSATRTNPIVLDRTETLRTIVAGQYVRRWHFHDFLEDHRERGVGPGGRLHGYHDWLPRHVVLREVAEKKKH